jgi:transposase
MAKHQTFSEEFKKQIVALYKNGKSIKTLIEEYKISKSVIYRWVKNFESSGSFKIKDNRSNEKNELIDLRKKLKQLEMENDILKQAALIIGRK